MHSKESRCSWPFGLGTLPAPHLSAALEVCFDTLLMLQLPCLGPRVPSSCSNGHAGYFWILISLAKFDHPGFGQSLG